MPPERSEITDKRVLRGRRNRDTVVRALIELISEGELEPTAAQIAERAGLSVRSIYHHFEDLPGLQKAVADEHFRSLVDIAVPVSPDGPLAARLGAFVDQRAAVHERSMPMYRASLLNASRSTAIAASMAFSNEYLRVDLSQTFANELTAEPSWKLDALDAVASIDGWVRLRIAQGLDVDATTQVLARTIDTILSARDR
jgi:TetR/AcrR family transcriptional regulator, regulator of autoinduction and epiphytic fitness